MLFVTAVQVIPSELYAIELVPFPTATHRVPFQATPSPELEKILVPNPTQLIPSELYAMVLVPCPTATHFLSVDVPKE